MGIRSFLKAVVTASLAVLTLSACDIQTYEDAAADFNNNTSGGGSPPPPTSPPPPAPPPPPPPPPPPAGASFGPIFSEIQAGLFNSCASACHSGNNPPGNLNLDANNSYMMLVGTPSDFDPNINRVEPGFPNNSYLITKLEEPHPSGSPVPQPDIDSIRVWITNGAEDDTVVPVVPVAVTSISPGRNAQLTAAPSNITVGFTKDLDASTVNTTTVQLVGAGGDSIFGNANDVPVALVDANISVPGANPASLVVDVSGFTLGDDDYRVTLRGTGASVILDVDGLALDGEFIARFPTGNGTAGGDFTSDFTIATPVVLEPNLQSIQDLVFTPSCTGVGCHSGGAPASQLDLSAAMTSYMELVGVPSVGAAGRILVIENDSANSYLIEKLENPNPTAGAQMPPGARPKLPPATIQVIEQWIDNGAAPP